MRDSDASILNLQFAYEKSESVIPEHFIVLRFIISLSHPEADCDIGGRCLDGSDLSMHLTRKGLGISRKSEQKIA